MNEINAQVFGSASVGALFMHISGKYLAKKSFSFLSNCSRASCKVVKHIAWLDFGQNKEVGLLCLMSSDGGNERHFPQVIVKFSQEFS